MAARATSLLIVYSRQYKAHALCMPIKPLEIYCISNAAYVQILVSHWALTEGNRGVSLWTWELLFTEEWVPLVWSTG